jgi:23S rRNA-/tRNA-specific pseudouridylate synthase
VVHTTPSARFGSVTTVDLWPHTGRTHQLRRHLAGLGHPIVGEVEHCPRELQVVRAPTANNTSPPPARTPAHERTRTTVRSPRKLNNRLTL